jgi:lipopolysaccharide/colanic/teichoic acid biosynthesis glycosyltransferase
MQSDYDAGELTWSSRRTMAVKRMLDIVGSALGLLLLAPVLPLIAIVIKLDSPGPIFFRQERVGRGGRSFRIFKFRSMVVGAARTGRALTVRGDPRITRMGMLLRRSKLDELPQLINVLAGDMSIVGPRPEVPEFMKFYTPDQRALMLSMRPGITDYAAILFRDESSLLDGDSDPIEVYRDRIMPIKFAFYERYSRQIGVVNDLRIILATILLLIVGRLPLWLGIECKLPPAMQRKNQTEILSDQLLAECAIEFPAITMTRPYGSLSPHNLPSGYGPSTN